MPKRRLGVALLVPDPLDREVDGLRRALGDPALGRIPPHLTLVPPVNVRHDRLGEALAVLRRAAGRARPVTVTLGPPATFMPDTPVVHLPVGGDQAQVTALHGLRDRLSTAPLERSLTWPFVPHVTLCDDARPDRIGPALAALADYSVEVTFDLVHLLEEGPGRVWTPLADVRLEPPTVVGRGGLELSLTVGSRPDPEAAALMAAVQPDGGADAPERAPARGPTAALAVTARRSGAVVGVAAGYLCGREAELAALVVAPEHRGTGAGTQLLAAFEARAAAEGCRAVTWSAACARTAAFLRGRGWTDDGGRFPDRLVRLL